MTFVAGSDPGHDPGGVGFAVVAGHDEGLRRLMLVTGRLPAGDIGPVHSHGGDEIIRVLRGKLMIRIGNERRVCGPGDTAAIPPGIEHGFVVEEDTVIEVVAEQQMGSFYALRPDGDGTSEATTVEVFRPEVPWDRVPPAGSGHTTPEQMAEIAVRVVGV